jgi:hypothetical protein
MWFTFVTARLFHSLSFQPRLAATLLSSCSVANSPTRRMGLSPTLRSVSLAQAACPVVWGPGGQSSRLPDSARSTTLCWYRFPT